MTIDDFCSVLGFDHEAKHILEDVWEEALAVRLFRKNFPVLSLIPSKEEV